MKYSDFENIVSTPRMSRYLGACNGDSKKAMTLYRYNLRLSQEMFTIISCFEITLRNKINGACTIHFGVNWLQDSVALGGVFDIRNCRFTKQAIVEAIRKLNLDYTHDKLVAELGFGFWRYLFAQHQYRATGRILLSIFPSKPVSTPRVQYNQNYVFNQLAEINKIRNRIAHHEPICFRLGHIDLGYVNHRYQIISELFKWMEIDDRALLYGLNHVSQIIEKIENL